MTASHSQKGLCIATRRLHLVCATLEIVRGELESHERFGAALGAKVPATWPPALYDRGAAEYTLARLQEAPANAEWWMWYIVLPDGDSRTLIGTSGFKGPPNGDGIVEVGYALLKAFQKQGYAAEALGGLVARAFTHPEVKAVRAQTLPTHAASIAVMTRNGLNFLCHAVDEGMQTVIYQIGREAFERAGKP